MKGTLIRLLWLALLGLVTSLPAQPAGTVLWSFTAGQPIQSSAALGMKGQVAFGADNGLIYVLDPGGIVRWSFKTGGTVPATPAVGTDGAVFAGGTDRVLYAIDPDGTIRWLSAPGSAIVASPALASDGTVYVATAFNVLYALGDDGSKKWEYLAGGNLASSPAIGADGTLYFGCRDNALYALNPNGTKKWIFQTGDRITASPAIGLDGTIYIGSQNGKLYAVNPDGTLKWTYAAGGAIRSSAAIGKDGTLYVGADDNGLHAVSPGGHGKWIFRTGGWVRSSPCVAADGTVYVGSYDNKLYAIAADGQMRWEFETGNYISASPVLDEKGVLYVGSWDGKLYAIKADAPLAVTSWPVFRGDAKRTGRAVLVLPQLAAKPTEPFGQGHPVKVVTTSDSTHPVVVITEPAVMMRIPQRQIRVAGTATDDHAIDRVEFQVNNGPVQRAQGTTNWSAKADLTAGMNRIWVKAVDVAGNESVVVSRNVIVITGRILVRTTGQGSVTPNLNDKETKFGETYTFQAVPDKGYVFAGWSDGLHSTESKISVTLETNIVLQANFVPNPYVAAEGGYNGLLLRRDEASLTPEGNLHLDLKEDGGWRAEFRTGTNRYTLNGQFDVEGESEAVGGKEAKSLPRLRLHLDLLNETGVLTGTLFTDQGLYELLADREGFRNSREACPMAGRYTLELGVQEGAGRTVKNGYAVLSVDAKGMARLDGRLPDGQVIAHEAPLSRRGIWPLYADLGPGEGQLAGWLRLVTGTNSDVQGKLNWVGGLAVAKNPSLQRTVQLAGSRYRPPDKKQPLLRFNNAVLVLEGGNLPDMIASLVTLEPGGVVRLMSGEKYQLKFDLNPATGQFEGRFRHPLTGQAIPFNGVILQRQNRATGFFIDSTATGQVFLLPGRGE